MWGCVRIKSREGALNGESWSIPITDSVHSYLKHSKLGSLVQSYSCLFIQCSCREQEGAFHDFLHRGPKGSRYAPVHVVVITRCFWISFIAKCSVACICLHISAPPIILYQSVLGAELFCHTVAVAVTESPTQGSQFLNGIAPSLYWNFAELTYEDLTI